MGNDKKDKKASALRQGKERAKILASHDREKRTKKKTEGEVSVTPFFDMDCNFILIETLTLPQTVSCFKTFLKNSNLKAVSSKNNLSQLINACSLSNFDVATRFEDAVVKHGRGLTQDVAFKEIIGDDIDSVLEKGKINVKTLWNNLFKCLLTLGRNEPFAQEILGHSILMCHLAIRLKKASVNGNIFQEKHLVTNFLEIAKKFQTRNPHNHIEESAMKAQNYVADVISALEGLQEPLEVCLSMPCYVCFNHFHIQIFVHLLPFLLFSKHQGEWQSPPPESCSLFNER
jgi:hypothetical protein